MYAKKTKYVLEPWKKYAHGSGGGGVDDPSGGYGNRFRVNAEEEGLEADIESAIVCSVFKTVVTRVVDAPQRTFDTVRTREKICLRYEKEQPYVRCT